MIGVAIRFYEQLLYYSLVNGIVLWVFHKLRCADMPYS